MSDRNNGFEETLDEQATQQLDSFVSELMLEIDDIERTLSPDNDSHRILLNWVRDKVFVLRDSFREGL